MLQWGQVTVWVHWSLPEAQGHVIAGFLKVQPKQMASECPGKSQITKECSAGNRSATLSCHRPLPTVGVSPSSFRQSVLEPGENSQVKVGAGDVAVHTLGVCHVCY